MKSDWMQQRNNKQPFRTEVMRLMQRTMAILLLPLLIGVSDLRAKSMVFSEGQIKAVYLFNLTSFVSWPGSAFDSPEAPLRIAVSGDDRVTSFIKLFRKVIEGETFGERTIVINRLPLSGDPNGYHILFITTSGESGSSHLLEAAKGQPILTVGDSAGFCQRGGMINLLRRENRIGLTVNIATVKAAKLQISSKLLRIAAIVKERGGDGGGQ